MNEEIKENDVNSEDIDDNVWRDEVKQELNEALSKFLPLTGSGGWGVKYINPIVETYEDGSVRLDENKAMGVVLYIQLHFDDEFNMELLDK